MICVCFREHRVEGEHRYDQHRQRHRLLQGDPLPVPQGPLRHQVLPQLHPPPREDLRLQDPGLDGHPSVPAAAQGPATDVLLRQPRPPHQTGTNKVGYLAARIFDPKIFISSA